MIDAKLKRHIVTGALMLGIFTITYTTLLILNLTPKQFQVEDQPNIFQVQREVTATPTQIEPVDSNLIPQNISIPKIDVNSSIQVPQAVDVATLDTALEKGAVYYPGSGTLQGGNMFLFGHSTNWKVVNNQAYQTFNGLEKLIKGDEIILTSNNVKYRYRVQTVTRASQEDTLIEFNKGTRMLTISTCDTFGRKQDRWIVEAVFEKII